jgi:signal transduction histidine kinase
VAAVPWFAVASHGPWLGAADPGDRSAGTDPDTFTAVGDLAVPVRTAAGVVAGVIRTHVRWRRAVHHPERLTDEPDPRTTTEVCIVDKTGRIMVGPARWLGKYWAGVPVAGNLPLERAAAVTPGDEMPRFEQLPDGSRALVAISALAAPDEITALGWRVQLIEPNARVFQRADALAQQIFWVSICLGVVTAALGIVGARRLTRRLKDLAASVAQVRRHAGARIEVPTGADEVAQLGQAFAQLLDELALERSELERRVEVRTGEVQRLAEESRYAAIVRERLTIARDLHDTLAHSMMALLSEIRLLRKLQARDPAALARELATAEQIAHEGLQEARNAITQMRANAVRETGLGPALAEVFKRFLNLTGLSGDFHADVTAARFGDERAETLVRMAREALRNVERHARATRVLMRLDVIDGAWLQLRIEDNGVGFDPQALEPGHYGLVGLREQAELIGAQLTIDSAPGSGTALRLVMRLSPVEFRPLGVTAV